MASGKCWEDKVKASGVDAMKRTQLHVALAEIQFGPDGHPLWHARALLFDPVNDPEDRRLVDRIKAEGFRSEKSIGVHDEGKGPDGKHILMPVFGSRRYNAACWAERELRAEGKLGPGDVYRIPVVRLDGDYAALLEERARENSDPEKKPNTATVLSAEFRALAALGRTDAQISHVYGGDRMPPDLVEALRRLVDLAAPDAARFDLGDLPLDVLPVVLDERPTQRSVFIVELEAARAWTAPAARRVLRRMHEEAKPAAARALSRKVLGRQVEAGTTYGSTPLCPNAQAVACFLAGVRHSIGDAKALAVLPGEVRADLQALLKEAAKPRRPGPKGKGVKG